MIKTKDSHAVMLAYIECYCVCVYFRLCIVFPKIVNVDNFYSLFCLILIDEAEICSKFELSMVWFSPVFICRQKLKIFPWKRKGWMSKYGVYLIVNCSAKKYFAAIVYTYFLILLMNRQMQERLRDLSEDENNQK